MVHIITVDSISSLPSDRVFGVAVEGDETFPDSSSSTKCRRVYRQRTKNTPLENCNNRLLSVDLATRAE